MMTTVSKPTCKIKYFQRQNIRHNILAIKTKTHLIRQLPRHSIGGSSIDSQIAALQ